MCQLLLARLCVHVECLVCIYIKVVSIKYIQSGRKLQLIFLYHAFVWAGEVSKLSWQLVWINVNHYDTVQVAVLWHLSHTAEQDGYIWIYNSQMYTVKQNNVLWLHELVKKLYTDITFGPVSSCALAALKWLAKLTKGKGKEKIYRLSNTKRICCWHHIIKFKEGVAGSCLYLFKILPGWTNLSGQLTPILQSWSDW